MRRVPGWCPRLGSTTQPCAAKGSPVPAGLGAAGSVTWSWGAWGLRWEPPGAALMPALPQNFYKEIDRQAMYIR